MGVPKSVLSWKPSRRKVAIGKARKKKAASLVRAVRKTAAKRRQSVKVVRTPLGFSKKRAFLHSA